MDESLKERLFRQAIKIACKSRPSPNPRVGAIVVKYGKIIASGYHKKAGEAHAEIVAMGAAGKQTKGSELIVTLEPCHLTGKTPPCTDAIIKSGIKAVYIGTIDPNPCECGKSIEILKKAGIKVYLETGKTKELCENLIREWSKYIVNHTPFVRIKAAMSLDGKIATSTGASKWISSPLSRKKVHRMRANHDSILVGIETVIKDDPELTVRDFNWHGPHPHRIILDSKLRIPLESKIVKTAKLFPTIIACTEGNSKEIEKAGVKILRCDRDENGRVNLRSLLKSLASTGITSILVEGGGTVITSFIENRLADEIVLFISPHIIGGRNSLSLITGKDIKEISESLFLKELTAKKSGSDIMVIGKF